MSSIVEDVARSAMAGASTGGRTFTAIAALALTAPPDAAGRPDRTLLAPWARGLLGVLAVGELVGDKLPVSPSRLEAPGLSGRLVFGALCGVVIARRDSADVAVPGEPLVDPDPTAIPGDAAGDSTLRSVVCAVTGAAAAAAASWLGVTWRARCTSWTHHDWIGAVAEDGVVFGLAAGAARSR